MAETTAARLAAALADRYRIERELGQGGMATVPRMNSLLSLPRAQRGGSAWLRHPKEPDTRMSRRDIVPSRGVQPREETGA